MTGERCRSGCALDYSLNHFNRTGPGGALPASIHRCRPRGRCVSGNRVPLLHRPRLGGDGHPRARTGVAAALHYEPNRAARGLITGRTSNVGVIVPDLGNPYFHAVLQGAQARARRGGLCRIRARRPGERHRGGVPHQRQAQAGRRYRPVLVASAHHQAGGARQPPDRGPAQPPRPRTRVGGGGPTG